MKVLDLFSGIGGFSLGLERAGMETVAFCEIEPFCQSVLQKHWPDIPVYDDIRGLSYERLQQDGITDINVICGGFPCQPYSLAGRKKGTEDNRDLWPEMLRIIREFRPAWVIGENVANFKNMAFTRTKIDLENSGYEVQPFIIPACAVGAPHRRDRIWIIAHTSSNGIQRGMSEPLPWQSSFSWCKNVRRVTDYFDRSDIPQPLICRESNGVSRRVDRLRSLGNSVVPQLVEVLGKAITANYDPKRVCRLDG